MILQKMLSFFIKIVLKHIFFFKYLKFWLNVYVNATEPRFMLCTIFVLQDSYTVHTYGAASNYSCH